MYHPVTVVEMQATDLLETHGCMVHFAAVQVHAGERRSETFYHTCHRNLLTSGYDRTYFFRAAARRQCQDLRVAFSSQVQFQSESSSNVFRRAVLDRLFVQVVLFCSCVLYMTSHDDFLERNIGDFLPVSQADRKVRATQAAYTFLYPSGRLSTKAAAIGICVSTPCAYLYRGRHVLGSVAN